MLINSFQRLASSIEVGALLKALEAKPALWSQITTRQELEGSPHRDTRCIFLRWCEDRSVEAAFRDIPAVDYPALAELSEARALISKVVELAEGTKLGRVLITSLKPGGRITPHSDEGAYADHYERFHLVLVASLGNLFIVQTSEQQGEVADMRPGEVWWFNHKAAHGVINDSDQERVHLIVDAVAPKYRQERAA